MAELTKKMKRMRKAVRRLNACVDVEALHRSVKKHWPVVNKMLEDGQLYLDGDLAFCFAPVGAPRNNWVECAPRPKDYLRAYPDGGRNEAEKELEDVRAKLTEFLVITTGIHEELVRLQYSGADEGIVAASPSGKILGHFQRLFPGVQVERTQFPVE